jgi:Glycine-zipper domain
MPHFSAKEKPVKLTPYASSRKRIFSCSLATLVFPLALLFSPAAEAQNSALYIYPLKKQSTEQQNKDRYECHSWAVQQTGFDPSRAYPSNPNQVDPQPYRPSQPHVVRGAGRGAALGAVGGAITGNAGKGAAAGAAMGGLAGGFRRRDERRQQANQQQAGAASAAASQQNNYSRAISACLEARGYSVK